MKRLTRAEEDIMQIIWKLGRCTVRNIRDYIREEMGLPEPPHSTVSTIVRILDDKKGFVGHKAYGRTYEYFPIVTKEAYSRHSLRKLAGDYFGGSMNRLVSFLVKQEDISLKDLSELLGQMEEE